ncbi:39S ribosomal protein L47, mitochondrial [Cichlidogyrus casuarinus]|uniref:Large ribosomal subunit protein uL29m n=1 Tax=Cichlidogyrus casuarinus TaxID=1844966 RepID=A0ABD2QK93_9PLAT
MFRCLRPNKLVSINNFAFKCLSTNQKHPLLAFFDDPKNWGATSVIAGRPWRKDELRLKSNVELHELWYVLLKERNMLMTMETEHQRCIEQMPNAERFEKVEESMENLLEVVNERNEAVHTLEHGEISGPSLVKDVDNFGREVTRLSSEHYEPKLANARYEEDEMHFCQTTVELLRQEREKALKKKRDIRRNERWDKMQKHHDRHTLTDEHLNTSIVNKL